MRIVFTGHRNCQTDEQELHRLHTEFPGATWVHGGAKGFDTQVADYAARHQIPCEVFRPDYSRCKSKAEYRGAPITRNVAMLETADLLVACYDGREGGGTSFCIQWARRRDIPARLISAFPGV